MNDETRPAAASARASPPIEKGAEGMIPVRPSAFAAVLVVAAALVAAPSVAQLRVSLEDPGEAYRVPKAILGANMIYTVETDQLRALGARGGDEGRGALAGAARDAGLGMLRFPGGTAAQNFNWITNQPLVPHGQASAKGMILTPRNLYRLADVARPDALMDFAEFARFARSVGAAPAVAVNLEGAFHSPEAPIEGLAGRNATGLDCRPRRDPVGCYVKLAAEWVHEANVRQGLGIVYWDLGNESFGLANRYSFTAQEYAGLVRRFSDAMKAVDPSIRIGVIGPHEAGGHAFADLLTERGLRRFRSLTQQERKGLRRQDGRRRSIEQIARDLNGGEDAARPTRWWPTVLRAARGAYDYAALHRLSDYGRSVRPGEMDLSRPVTIGKALEEFAETSTRAAGAPTPVSLNAWTSVPADAGDKDRLPPFGVYLTALEVLGQIAEEEVDSAATWPFSHGVSKGIAQLRGGKNGRPWRVRPGQMSVPHRDFSAFVGGRVLEARGAGRLVYVFAARLPDRLEVMVLNKDGGGRRLEVEMPEPAAGAARVELVRGDDLSRRSGEGQASGRTLSLRAPGESVVFATVPMGADDGGGGSVFGIRFGGSDDGGATGPIEDR